MTYSGGHIQTDFLKRATTDQSIKGLKKLNKENPKVAKEIIKNTYRTLMTRGQKGCYIYCVDKNLSDYLKCRLGKFDKVIRYTTNEQYGWGMVAEDRNK